MIREPNSQRKALRVTIPLRAEIAGTVHEVRNWSTTGLGTAALAEPPAEGHTLPARLSFPMQDSLLVLPVQLTYRGRHGEVDGFDFHELSPRNRRLLRHYIDMSVEGRLDDVEGLVAVAGLPATHSPIEVPAALELPHARTTLDAHRARGWGAALLGLLFVAGLGALAFYNYAYKVEGTGFVSGSIARVTANAEGRIGRMLVAPNTQVEPGMPLFSVENPQLRDEIEAMEQHAAQLAAEQARLAAAQRRAQSGLLVALQRDTASREAELANARKLLEGGAITQRELMLVSNDVAGARQDYLRQMADGANRSLTFESNDSLNRLRLELAAKKVLLARQETERVVRAPARGKVFHVDKASGEYVAAHDPVVLLETDVTPSVLLRLPNDDALKLQIGMPATISAIGLAAVNAAAPVTLEGGLNETLVKLEFEDKGVRLPANTRVSVWVRSLSSLLS
jgi:multidrug resistance efflux pump